MNKDFGGSAERTFCGQFSWCGSYFGVRGFCKQNNNNNKINRVYKIDMKFNIQIICICEMKEAQILNWTTRTRQIYSTRCVSRRRRDSSFTRGH